MAINKNHEFEDLDGVKCAIVEKNATQDRVDFLRQLLKLNGYDVVVVASAPSKTTGAAVPGEEGTTPPMPVTFTVGVTDVSFNPINAVYGRLLKTAQGNVVTPKYWQQKEIVSHDEVPYFERS